MSFFRKNTTSTKPATTTSSAATKQQPEAPNFEESWTKLQNGFAKLIDFLDSRGKTPFDNAEYSTLYTFAIFEYFHFSFLNIFFVELFTIYVPKKLIQAN